MNQKSMRLQKFLSRAGVASRRAAEELMIQGRVRVNGTPAVELGIQVDPTVDRVEVDGRPVRIEATRWILLNKPAGVLTTRSDPQGRPTVYDLLDPRDRSLPYVGRLDMDTEGLLLFTNEGDDMNALLHPSSEIPREYRVVVGGVPNVETLDLLRRGIELEDGVARAHDVRFVKEVEKGLGAVLEIVILEGKKREVRRMFDAVGHSVRELARVRFGPLRLSGVQVGEWRELTSDEVKALKRAAR
jgi:23S rRNA pseudouridine2605 synthase